MEMSFDPVQNAHDHAMIIQWAQAMDLDPAHMFAVANTPNLFWYAKNLNLKFYPEWSPTGLLLHTKRLEHLREALIHECLSNLLDIGMNLDDDPSESLSMYYRLTAVTNMDERHRPAWLTVPTDSLILKTVSREIIQAWEG